MIAGTQRRYYFVEHDEDNKGGFHWAVAEGLDLGDFGVVFQDRPSAGHLRQRAHFTQSELIRTGFFTTPDEAVQHRRALIQSMIDLSLAEVRKQEARIQQLDRLLDQLPAAPDAADKDESHD